MALLASLVAMAVAGAAPGAEAAGANAPPPNILIVLTDDQSPSTLPSVVGRPAMPWLEGQMADPDGHWVSFSEAFVDTPLCCPSRATILTGLTSAHTGVASNSDGSDLDESSTLATWLDAKGYTTGLFGKYLNGFPWDRGPYVPDGWDRFVAKENRSLSTTYYGYDLVDQGMERTAGDDPGDYATTYLAAETLRFIRSTPVDDPWFALFAPSAPHAPWVAAPGDGGAFSGARVPGPSARILNDVEGKPGWIRALPPISPTDAATLESQRRREREALLEVDRSIRSLVEAIEERGELDRTLIVFMTDNGFSFGEHRWIGKRCPYEPCVRTPLAIRSPWASSSTVETLVTNVDLAPTIMDMVAEPGALVAPIPSDGVSFRPVLEQGSATGPGADPGEGGDPASLRGGRAGPAVDRRSHP